MAEGWTTSNVLCRYYMNGACRARTCRFSHDRENSRPSNVCRYYLRGHCAYGETCRYDHVRSENLEARRQPATNAKNNNANNSRPVIRDTAAPKLVAEESPVSSLVTERRPQTTTSTQRNNQPTSPAAASTSAWVNAPEFIPIQTNKSYASAVAPEGIPEGSPPQEPSQPPALGSKDILCPFALLGDCRFGDKCIYIHGEECELCGHACLHPTDQASRKLHLEECVREHERDMELSFAVARSVDKTCGICMDVIMEKNPSSERRFGILPNCAHIFCLSCIRKWRTAKQFENRIIRSCPECRTPSDFVTPSKYWVDTKEEKDKLIEDYKKALSAKPCKYFKQGRGECPFAGNCFYLHAYPDGTKAVLPPPQPRRRRNADGELEAMQQMVLWEFLEERDNRWMLHFDFDDMLDFFTDSDDSDWSGSELEWYERDI